jgi:hypothetical protein
MAEATAASGHVMATAFEKAIKPLVEGYLKQIPELDPETRKKLDALDAAIAAVGPDTPEGKAITKQKAKLEPDMSKLKQRRIQEVSEAVVVACNNHRLAVMVKKTKRPASPAGVPGKSGGRLPKAELEAACESVLKVLPPKSGKFMNGSEVAEKTGLDAHTTKSALGKLKREDQITSNGMKGKGGGYRKA